MPQPPKPITDIIPWPNGEGFEGGEAWWKHVLSQDEHSRFDTLLLAALLSDEVCQFLLSHNDEVLTCFGFSEETIGILSAIEAHTLPEFAHALLQMSDLEGISDAPGMAP